MKEYFFNGKEIKTSDNIGILNYERWKQDNQEMATFVEEFARLWPNQTLEDFKNKLDPKAIWRFDEGWGLFLGMIKPDDDKS